MHACTCLFCVYLCMYVCIKLFPTWNNPAALGYEDMDNITEKTLQEVVMLQEIDVDKTTTVSFGPSTRGKI